MAGKVTVGLASHWSQTDNTGITTYGLMALERGMSTPPTPSRSLAQFTYRKKHIKIKKTLEEIKDEKNRVSDELK